MLYVNGVKIIKDFWRPETCGSTASSRTRNKLAKFAATDYYRNGNLRWVQKGKRRIRETQPWAAIKHDTPGATAAQTSPKAAAGRQAKGEDGSRPVPVAAPCPPLLPAAPTPPPRWRSESQLPASAPAPPKPAGRAGGCRSLPSRCFIRGCAKHRRLKPAQCRRRRQTQAGSEGNARLFSPARRQTMTNLQSRLRSCPCDSQGRDGHTTAATLSLPQASALSHLSPPHLGNRWEMRSPKLRGQESAPAARGWRACRGPALCACMSACWSAAAQSAQGKKR